MSKLPLDQNHRAGEVQWFSPCLLKTGWLSLKAFCFAFEYLIIVGETVATIS